MGLKSAIQINFDSIEKLKYLLLEKHFPHGFDSKPVILVMCSGGPDSLALLDRINSYVRINSLNYGVEAWHFNYEDNYSDIEQSYVKRYCEKNDINLHIVSSSSSGLPVFMGNGLESTWRKQRYMSVRDFQLSALAQKDPILYIPVTAHTKDDVIETMLMNFVRNPGIIKEDFFSPVSEIVFSDFTVARPILKCTKDSIYQHLRVFKIPYFQDPNNSDPKFLRSRVRNELLPLIKSINSGFGKKVFNEA